MSPRKKRVAPSDDGTGTTPKRLRTRSFASLSEATASRPATPSPLPTHIARIQTIHRCLEHALTHALATSGVSPSAGTGRVPNVFNHLSLSTAAGFTVKCDADDIKRLCWILEWDGDTVPVEATRPKTAWDDLENPFLVPPKDWIRGAMGIIITPTTYFSRTEGKRMPAYGIGIEVGMDASEGNGGGMAAVARWTAGGESRKRDLEAKLRTWVKGHAAACIHPIPLADLPILVPTGNTSPLPKFVVKSAATSPSKSPDKHPVFARRTPREFASPFPVTPQTPSTSPHKLDPELAELRIPQTPARQVGSGAVTAPQTPTTHRRAALYERIKQKSTPSGRAEASSSGTCGKDKTAVLGQVGLKRRCLLGRLDEVAATVWALFSQTSSTPLSIARKRRTMQTQEVLHALVKSATVPISTSDARESITLLTQLCPFFLRPLVIAGEEWLEMPASNPTSSSPRTSKTVCGGLHEVRERLRKEIELNG